MTTHTLHTAARMALDALDNLGSMSDHDVTPYAWHGAKAEQACTALREALAQAAPEPVAWMREGWGPDCGPYTEIYTEAEMTWRDRKEWTPLYAAPPAAPAPAAPVPDGWVMVPMEPTEDMIQAAADAWEGSEAGLHNAFAAALRGGIAASPATPPAAPDSEALAVALSNIGTMSPRLRKLYDDAAAMLRAQAAPPAAPAPVVPDGMALVPDYRGYAALGTGQYLLDISGDANPAELIIHVATDAEKEGRTVGDLRDKAKPGEIIQPEKMAVRLAFFTVAGLDALEQQLRILRETHFAESAAPAQPADQWKQAIDDELVCCHIGTADSFPDAKSALKAVLDWHVKIALDPAVSSDAQALIDRGAAQPVPLTDEQIAQIASTPCAVVGSYVHTFARAIERAHGIGTTGGGNG